MEKKYRSRWPSFGSGLGIKFSRYEFVTSDPEQQNAIEGLREFGRGITLVEEDGKPVAPPKRKRPEPPAAVVELAKATKAELQEYLRGRGIEFDDALTRPQLLGLAVRKRKEEEDQGAATSTSLAPGRASRAPAPPQDEEDEGSLPSTDGTV